MPKRTCTVDGCERKHLARGLCGTHYNQQYQPNRHKKITVECGYCGQPCEKYESKRFAARFCSLNCRDAERKRVRTERLVPVKVTDGAWCTLADGHPVMRYARTQEFEGRWWTVLVSGPCAWCTTSFTVGSTGGAAYCSTRCARQATRARHGRFLIQPQRRLAIYERDDWTCQLCFEPVDRDLMTTDPFNDWAPSLDHIECQSWTLVPDHSDENLRLAHRWCNAVRGDGSHYTEDDLRISHVA